MHPLQKLLLCIAFALALSGSRTFATPVPETVDLGQGLRSLSNDVAMDADKELRNIADTILPKYETEDQALEALKAKSERLYNKAVELRNFLKEKISALNPEAKEFVDLVIEKLKALRPKSDEVPSASVVDSTLETLNAKYIALSEEARESLNVNFPKLSGILSSIKNTT